MSWDFCRHGNVKESCFVCDFKYRSSGMKDEDWNWFRKDTTGLIDFVMLDYLERLVLILWPC
jgi:hypothetical protein